MKLPEAVLACSCLQESTPTKRRLIAKTTPPSPTASSGHFSVSRSEDGSVSPEALQEALVHANRSLGEARRSALWARMTRATSHKHCPPLIAEPGGERLGTLPCLSLVSLSQTRVRR